MNELTSLTSRIRIPLEETKKLDYQTLARTGIFKPGKTGTLTWFVSGQSSGTVGFQYDNHRLELSYRYKNFDGQWQPVKQAIEIASLVTVHGFHQELFLCPSCHSKVSTLAGYGKYFLCRHCYQSPSRSSRERPGHHRQLPSHFYTSYSKGYLSHSKTDRYSPADLSAKHCELVVTEFLPSDSSLQVS